MKNIFVLSLLSILFFTSCKNDDDNSNQTDTINIRLENNSTYAFSNITVNPYNEQTTYADLTAQETSAYQSFSLAYRYAFVELEIDGNTYTIQPIDFVGETPLENGYYTYKLEANESTEQYGKLHLIFVVD